MSATSDQFKDVLLGMICDYRKDIPDNIEGSDDELMEAYNQGYTAASTSATSLSNPFPEPEHDAVYTQHTAWGAGFIAYYAEHKL